MFNEKYALEIVSKLPEFKSKTLKKYSVDGIETVGAWGDEPFEIRFRNNTSSRVQVKLTMDGTDILTGKPASTEVSKDMWLVEANSSISLKAWPETSNGGAAFVFTSAKNSVAAHTHGDMSSRGIIAAAVYVEGYKEPERFYKSAPQYLGGNFERSKGLIGGQMRGSSSGTYGSSGNSDSFNFSDSYGVGLESMFNSAPAGAASDSLNVDRSRDEESLVSVGAGQHVVQKLTYVQGLKQPVFTETVRVRYLWWDNLVAKLKQGNVAEPHASGFPGDPQQKLSLGTTPRVGATSSKSVTEQLFSRV